ncbi:MAG: hypothetical protein AB7T06_33130 [Kofleriaceae bacterium]
MLRTYALALVFVSVVGCSKKDGGGGSDKPAGPTQLPKLSLQIDVPGSVTVSNAIGGEGHMLMGEGIGAMTITVEKEAKTLDAAKSDAEMYSPKNLKEEKLADGWALTFENTGSMGKNYFVEVRRDIDGKSYSCSTTSPDDRAQKVLAACKTLRK